MALAVIPACGPERAGLILKGSRFAPSLCNLMRFLNLGNLFQEDDGALRAIFLNLASLFAHFKKCNLKITWFAFLDSQIPALLNIAIRNSLKTTDGCHLPYYSLFDLGLRMSPFLYA